MASKAKTRKSMSKRTQGLICSILMIAVIALVSCLGFSGMKLDAEGVNVLLPWVPVSSQNWPQSLPLDRDLGGARVHEYALTADEGLDAAEVAGNAANIIKTRLNAMGETDAAITVSEDNGISVELRQSLRHADMDAMLQNATVPAKFAVTSSDGTAALTGKDVKDVTTAYNSRGTALILTFSFTDEGKEKLAALDTVSPSLTLDGDLIGYGSVKGDQVEVTVTSASVASNVAFFVRNGAIDGSLAMTGEDTVEARHPQVLSMLLIIAAVLLAAMLIRFVSGRLTAMAAFFGAWCALVIELFLFATVIVKPFSLLVGIGLLLGLVWACMLLVCRNAAIAKEIKGGAAVKLAIKVASKNSARFIWCCEGVLAAAAIVLMLIGATEVIGNFLFVVAASAACGIAVMRLLLAAFSSCEKNPALFGKVTK